MFHKNMTAKEITDWAAWKVWCAALIYSPDDWRYHCYFEHWHGCMPLKDDFRRIKTDGTGWVHSYYSFV